MPNINHESSDSICNILSYSILRVTNAGFLPLEMKMRVFFSKARLVLLLPTFHHFIGTLRCSQVSKHHGQGSGHYLSSFARAAITKHHRLKQQKLIFLQSRSWKSEIKVSSSEAWSGSSSPCVLTLSPLCVLVSQSALIKDSSHTALGPALLASFWLNFSLRKFPPNTVTPWSTSV